MEYLHGDLDKSNEVLRAAQQTKSRSFSETGVSVPLIFHNNMACLHQKVGKHNFASFLFREALQEHERVFVTYLKIFL